MWDRGFTFSRWNVYSIICWKIFSFSIRLLWLFLFCFVKDQIALDMQVYGWALLSSTGLPVFKEGFPSLPSLHVNLKSTEVKSSGPCDFELLSQTCSWFLNSSLSCTHTKAAMENRVPTLGLLDVTLLTERVMVDLTKVGISYCERMQRHRSRAMFIQYLQEYFRHIV